ncbi:hypothetical protein BpHYR1_014049 [Brachionus plicatilis]|uniref:Uncharacterized protein n=1 Tax=Brachionus plicatilis TaxID=10195 RepID=A0A3M7T6G1_BRAPC|nr:hypothetical protein BpHYR1_014049 [Brachionus plicatilis]
MSGPLAVKTSSTESRFWTANTRSFQLINQNSFIVNLSTDLSKTLTNSFHDLSLNNSIKFLTFSGTFAINLARNKLDLEASSKPGIPFDNKYSISWQNEAIVSSGDFLHPSLNAFITSSISPFAKKFKPLKI